MFKRLSEPTGEVDNSPQPGDTENQIVRRAILVHAGPNRTPMSFMSGDGPIVFDENRIKQVVEVHNAYLDQLAKQYGGEDKIPMGAFEPILDSHETGSNEKVIGRLTGRLKFEVRDVPKVGPNVPCAVADPGITFLGKDTVERVTDGRIYHLSIGISEKTNRLGETSTVVKPAAPGAMLLGDGKKTGKGGSNMSVDIKRMKAHTEKLSRLSAMKETFGDFTKKLSATSSNVKMTQKKGEITHRLTQAMRSGKLTPGEYKDLLSKTDNLTKLAALDDATLNVALLPIESRQERVIMAGQIGSTSTNDFSDMAKDMAKQKNEQEFKRLRAEFNTDMKRMTGKKLAEGEKEEGEYKKEMSGPVEAPVKPGADEHVVPGQAGDEQQLKYHLAEMGKHLASGDIEAAKKSHAALCHMAMGGTKHMAEYTGDVKSEDYVKGMGDLQKQVDDLNTQMSRMAGMVEEMMAAEAEEGEHFGKISEEHAGVAS